MNKTVENPIVSVVIPLYNGANKIGKCLRSLDNQDFSGTFEVLIIDDCSTDDSVEKVKRTIAELNRKEYFRIIECEKNGRAGKARNIGIKEAQGEYILFVDQDDFVSNSIINILYQHSENGRYDLVSCNIREGNDKIYERYYCKNVVRLNASKRNELLQKNFGYVFGMLVRRSMIIDNQLFFPENVMFEDSLYNLGLLVNAQSINSTKEDLYFRTVDENSQTGSLSKKKINDRIIATCYYYSRYQREEKYKEYLEVIKKYAFYYVYLSSMWWLITKPELFDKELFNLSLNKAREMNYNWSQVFYPYAQEHKGQTAILKQIYLFPQVNILFRILAKNAKNIRRIIRGK